MTTPSQADVFGTSAWQTGTAGLTSKFSGVLRKYGIVPDSATLSQYGLSGLFDPNQSANALANPDSIFNKLGRARDTGFTSNLHTANSHNALFSGAALNSADQVGRDYASNVGQAGQDELDALMGVGGEAGNLYQTVFGDLLNRPVAADPTVYPTSSPSSGGTIGAGRPVPQQPYIRTGPETPGATPKKAATPKAAAPKFSTTMGRY